MRRSIDLLLLLAAIIGGALAWQTGRERQRLRTEYDRLCQLTGDLPLGDPTKVHIKAIDTGEPLHFAWHCYFPPNYKAVWSRGSGWSSSQHRDSREFVARVRFGKDELGVPSVFQRYDSGGTYGGLNAEFILDHASEIQVEQIGVDRSVAFGSNESVVVLRLTVPEKLRKTARKKLRWLKDSPVLFELTLGPNPTTAKP